MTGLLKDLMHDRADRLDAPDLDLGSITSTGDRRVRRRRTTLAGGLAAAALAVGLAVPALLPGDGGGGTDQVADGTDVNPVALSWITGSTLHREGQPDIDLGADVRAWVWSGAAVVYTDSDREVHVWRDGETRSVGTTTAGSPDDAELVADGSQVAWIDDRRGLTVYSVISEETWHVQVEQSKAPARVTALDAGEVYAIDDNEATAVDAGTVFAVDDRGVIAWRVRASGRVEVLNDEPDASVFDTENGTTVQGTEGGGAQVTGPGGSITVTVDSFANLSPSGAYVMAESNDEGILLDTATGARIELESGHEWALPYQWLDDGTVAVLAFDGVDGPESDMTAYLQSCETATGECTAPGTELPGTFQLPGGIHFSD